MSMLTALIAQAALALPMLPPVPWGSDVATTQAALGADARVVAPDRDQQVWNQDKRLVVPATVEGIAGESQAFFTAKGELSLSKFRVGDGAKDCPALLTAMERALGPGVNEEEPEARGIRLSQADLAAAGRGPRGSLHVCPSPRQ
ncbi:hypothetical protein K9B35_17500 [Sphingomonas sp. R647]|uniref:hypothetical protein n=1 Tax=Sphingomonas sp. R647 TaxID=2875233 RepID=UPI001CD57004|nr:hypothetical protein [Sphingomonas sp. R647]MCA1199766.1 hypothetical protein [Sphingomonas sp. R647]